MNSPFLEEAPLLIMPKLATLIGLNEAIVLKQIHYWLKNKEQKKLDYIDGCYWVYNSYTKWQEQFPFWSVNTLKRIFKNLENKNLLFTANYNKAGFDKTKWYSINYEELNSLYFSLYQNEPTTVPSWYDGEYQLEPTNTIDYPTKNISQTNSKRDIGSSIVENAAYSPAPPPKLSNDKFNFNIVIRQIKSVCKEINQFENSEEIIDVFRYFYECYYKHFGQPHPKLTKKSIKNIVEFFYYDGNDKEFCYDLSNYEYLIDKYFDTKFNNCNYSIAHFMSGDIRKLRYYEECY